MAKSFYEVKKQMDGVYSLTNCVTCMYLVIGREKALVFDTGYGFADCLPEIRKLTDKPLTVVDSHGHFDHISGNYLFGCPVYISEKDMETVGRHSSPEYRKIPSSPYQRLKNWCFGRSGSRRNWTGRVISTGNRSMIISSFRKARYSILET